MGLNLDPISNTSFHSISFPSEQRLGEVVGQNPDKEIVSIQLVSLASRDYLWNWLMPIIFGFPFNQFPQRVGTVVMQTTSLKTTGFHSISFPSEWESKRRLAEALADRKFPFNQFSQRVGKFLLSFLPLKEISGFHSISFPSEWESKRLYRNPSH